MDLAAQAGSRPQSVDNAHRRIVFVSNFYPPATVGGAEVVAHRQALALKERGWEVFAFAGQLTAGAVPGGTLVTNEQDGIPVYRLEIQSLDPDSNFSWPLAEAYFRALVSAYDIKWVFCHNVIGLGVGIIPLARSMGLRVITTLHDNWGHCYRGTRLREDGSVCDTPQECWACHPGIRIPSGGRLPIRVRRDYVAWCLEQADTLISPSRFTARSYDEAGVARHRINAVSNGIDLHAIPPVIRSGEGPINFLCAAYMGEHKGIPQLLEAAELLWRREDLRGRWTLSLAGAGHLAPMVQARLAASKFGDAVRFLGKLPRAELIRTLSRSQAVVLPSVWPENEPVILLESIASGAVPIATNLGGNPELIHDGETGILVERAAPAAIAAAMIHLIENGPSLIPTLSAANLAQRDRLSERHTMDRLETLLTDPPAPAPAPLPVIICGGGEPDLGSKILINTLHDLLPDTPIRLIWQDWADAQTWSGAVAYWHWTRESDLLPAFERAARYGLPVITRSDPNLTARFNWTAGLHHYQQPEGFAAILQQLLSTPPSDQMKPEVALSKSILRAYTMLRDRRDFRLEAATLK
ncbi:MULTISPECIES: glycosyltransferase [Nitrospirillum]|uniref:Glycosyltransferase involved in cell wall biosynthesis n=1 Tax=Nitrospirillum amazonense TaxID=28077 RepID=A0A560FXL2_9PROT|nr:glycosyltransferase [Nitrospirillum amazonense]MEC4590392.1 glycosyltransferase [Nitrospirillum amazonense]TWB26319.1 glycosyltransferase involved in cell wall biosynthesis [Nitrospirillum amazonense]